jgi:uncharacterized membrane protein
MELARWLGSLHPNLVQFPLVLLLAGLIFDLLGLIGRKESFHWAAKRLTGAGTVMLLIAFICGIYAEVWAGRAGIPQHPIEWHEFLANVSSWGFVLLAAWRIFLGSRQRAGLGAYVIVGLGFYILLGLTAYLGGKLVFDYGAAVTADNSGSAILSLHDLNTLATRQTDKNLEYSEMMHHIFGWITLALSGSLLAQALFPKRSEKVQWVGPTLLLLGGIFLFFFADLDLYRFLDPRQLRDREVQLHKTIALVLTVAGIVGLRRKKVTVATPDKPVDGQSKLVAVIALIGGGLLFTHVHTVAPYANVAAGVYIAHVTLGLVALSIGAARLMQDRWPRHRQGLVVAFAALMCVESILLITYNEGLPWYIGYGHYNRKGPHDLEHSVIAPYGPLRAELTFDEKSQRFDVYLLDRFKDDQPAPVAVNKLNVLVSRGYEEIAVPVEAADTQNGTAAHFFGPAEALKGIEAFSARLAVPVHGSMRMGYFDPWVTGIVAAIPPNEVAKYYCPMHDALRSKEPGNCPLCGMPMIPIATVRPTTLHDPPYTMAFSATGIGLARHLSFTPQFEGATLRDLALVHEKLLHLIIVSSDLQRFDHVHPTLRSDGSFQMDYTFAGAGDYLLFADITPRGQRSQVFREEVPIGGGVAVPAHLAVSPAGAAIVADNPHIVAQLITSPRDLSAGIESYLLFRLSVDGQPLTDLQPYLGAMGHCVIVSEDGQTYLHSHPEQLFNPTPDARGGPAVMFHTIFPRPGLYKVWGQFQRNEKVIISSFVVKVGHPWLPPRMVNFILND